MPTFQQVVKQIAQKRGISPEEVYREMQEAIEAGLSNPDPAVQAAWEKVPRPFGTPRPEDFVAYCLLESER